MEDIFIKAEVVGNDDDVRELFIRAANKDPEAVGRVWTLFPAHEDRKEICDMYFGQNERPKVIHDPGSLGAELVEAIYDAPHSEEAGHARRALLKLISPSVSQGGIIRKGRPKISVPQSTLILLWKMCYCLTLQIRQVLRALDDNEMSSKDQAATTLSFYPWISSITGRDVLSFLKFSPSQAASNLLQRISKISPRAVDRLKGSSIR